MTTTISNRFPLWALLAASATVTFAISVVHFTNTADLTTFFANVHPSIATMLICVSGVGAFYNLHRYFDFTVFGTESFKRGIPVATALAIPFMIAVTIADIVFRFPADMNVPLPVALVFYPAIGYIAQVSLHVVPLATVLLALYFLPPTGSSKHRLWAGILLVSTVEASFQAVSTTTSGGSAGITIYVAVSLFLFGVAELFLFRRYDYATMFAFRAIYYSYWHIAWGHLRLGWLF